MLWAFSFCAHVVADHPCAGPGALRHTQGVRWPRVAVGFARFFRGLPMLIDLNVDACMWQLSDVHGRQFITAAGGVVERLLCRASAGVILFD